MGKKVKKTTYIVGRFYSYPAGEFFRFYFKLPRFHQLLAVYIITLKRVIWFFPEGSQLLLCLLNSLGSSVTAAAYSHRKAGRLVRGGSGDQASRWDWTGLKKWEVRASTHNIYTYCVYPYPSLLQSP